jgi:hypothetical protein
MMVLPGEDFNRRRRISAFDPADDARKAKTPAGRQGSFFIAQKPPSEID